MTDNIFFSSFFQEQGQVFRSSGSGQWGRFSAMWSITLPFSNKDRSVTHIEWSDDAHTITFASGYQQPTSINLEDMIDAIQLVPRELWVLLLQMFPQEQTQELENFSIKSLFDDPDDPMSLFSQPKNANVFTPLHKSLEQHVFANKSTHLNLLETSQQFLQKLVQCLVTCNGISPRAKQISLLKVAAAGLYPRNIYLKNEICYVGKPPPKQRHFMQQTLYYEAYWALDAKAGRALLLYCGVVRPVVLRLLKLDKSAQANSFLFLLPPPSSVTKRRITRTWTGKMINACLRLAGSPLQLEARACRHITKAVMQKHLHREASQISSTFQVYSQNSPSDGIPRDQQLTFSQRVHVFFGIASASAVRSSSLPNQDPVKCLERYALARARNLVLTTYKLFGAPPEDIKRRVQKLADTMPFLYRNGSKEDWTELGDPVLIETTITIIFGDSQPGITAVVPFYGYEPPQVAAALAAVCTLTDSMGCVQYSPCSIFYRSGLLSRSTEKVPTCALIAPQQISGSGKCSLKS